MIAAAAIHDDRRLPALTGMRFFAAIAVVVSHLAERHFIPPIPGVVFFFDGGSTAVALFFVLSGFVLAYNYSGIGEPGSRRTFYVARMARIWPTVLLALALAAVGVTYAYIHRSQELLLDWYALTNHVELFLALSFVAQVLMVTGWLPSASLNQPWNGPAWSISCEMFFYAVFPVLMMRLRRQSAGTLVVVVLVGFALQSVWIFLFAPHAPLGQRQFLVNQFPLPHLVEFVFGIVAAICFARGGREWLGKSGNRTKLLLAAVVPIVLLSAVHPVTPAYPVLTPFFAMLVLALAAPPARRSSWLAWRPLLLLGEASFALYLIHIPLLNIASIWMPLRSMGWPLLVVLVLLSVAVFQVYEAPARRTVKRLLAPALRRPSRV